ncbi:uncharacterized protein LOC110006896 isoform X2 [Amborella trichopoda]|uniref:uncharacterized protein LOC110006896 isoform X2 n=1 Tax=Amborella trichopoda TaxID=13333 RepID=UPI0009BDD288|nr:uncharacterized protein LOC110006896 isoform X2 [Amborella trichopoda]|eukprot:XP_020520428.1 uncharacterized protein LOC110006896 isoform X2 [Amborella trichopoda]
MTKLIASFVVLVAAFLLCSATTTGRMTNEDPMRLDLMKKEEPMMMRPRMMDNDASMMMMMPDFMRKDTHMKPRTMMMGEYEGMKARHATLDLSESWCIARPCVDDFRLRNNIDYVCQSIAMNCSVVEQGGSCYSPDNLQAHASVVMNLYYKAKGQAPVNCDFSKSGIVVYENPSYFGTCNFA